jgi:hypothetical protein
MIDLAWQYALLMIAAGGSGWVAAKVHAEAEAERRDRARQDALMRATMRGRR